MNYQTSGVQTIVVLTPQFYLNMIQEPGAGESLE